MVWQRYWTAAGTGRTGRLKFMDCHSDTVDDIPPVVLSGDRGERPSNSHHHGIGFGIRGGDGRDRRHCRRHATTTRNHRYYYRDNDRQRRSDNMALVQVQQQTT